MSNPESRRCSRPPAPSDRGTATDLDGPRAYLPHTDLASRGRSPSNGGISARSSRRERTMGAEPNLDMQPPTVFASRTLRRRQLLALEDSNAGKGGAWGIGPSRFDPEVTRPRTHRRTSSYPQGVSPEDTNRCTSDGDSRCLGFARPVGLRPTHGSLWLDVLTQVRRGAGGRCFNID
jgi:hypothetical protein